MFTTTPKYHESGLVGAGPGEWYGLDLPDGDRDPWASAPVGSLYVYRPTSSIAWTYRKAKTGVRNDDWVLEPSVQTWRVLASAFTDGGSTIGTYTWAAALPAGVFVERFYLVNLTGFTGDPSTATIQVGDGTTVDRWSTSTPSVYTTATYLTLGAVSGIPFTIIANDLKLTVTGASDYTLIKAAAGALTLVLQYHGVKL